MPKKKQVIFQNSISGKFIPRNLPSSGSVFPSGANDNRFNSKMAELLAASSSSIINDENELVSTKSSQDHTTAMHSSSIHSKLFHRRIVTMIETLDDLSVTSSHIEQKSQPITFGQLRQATISSTPATTVEDKSVSQQMIIDTEQKHQKVLQSFGRDNTSGTLKSSAKYQTNKERLYYSPSLEQLFEEQNSVSQTKKEEEQSSLTVDEILAMYYSKGKLPTNTESHLTYPSSTAFYIHPSVPRWNYSQIILPPPPLILNEQNRNRPPPPSYSSTVASVHRTTSTVVNPTQHLIRPSVSTSILEHLYSGSSTTQHLFIEDSPGILPSSVSPFVLTLTNPTSNTSLRPPPPRYRSPTSNVKHSHSSLSSLNDSSTSNHQSKTTNTNNNHSSSGFDREFSRLLYGKDVGRTRRKKQKRKAFSDPVKKSVEEAGRSVEKARRRVTTHLNKTDVVKETDDDESESERSNNRKHELNFLPRRCFQRQSDLIKNNRESIKKSIVSTNPLLKRRIPSFLRVYSQAPSSNDILLQWDLFNLSELESFSTMITRLYKKENLARVQLYETYRSALLSALASKISLNTYSELDRITTPL